MKLVSFQEIAKNPYFWQYYLSVCFPLAFDEETELTLADFIYDTYDCTGEAERWVDAFVQFSEEIMQAHDGIAPDPTTVVIPAAPNEYAVQFHPGDTLFFLNGRKLGSTGPHYDLHKLPFWTYSVLYQKIGFPAVLLLPLAAVEEKEAGFAAVLIQSLLRKTTLREEDISSVTSMILEGLKP